MEEILFLIGRILLGGFFVMNGINHFAQGEMMRGYAQAKGVPSPNLAVPATGVLLLIGGLSFITGVLPIVGIAALVLFLVPTAFMMHQFWVEEDPQAKMTEMSNFMRNIGLLGAVLMAAGFGSEWSNSLF